MNNMKNEIRAFELKVSDAEILDLVLRLKRTRYPDQTPGDKWKFGTDKQYLSDLINYWSTEFDWRKQEDKLNFFPQFKVKLDDIDLHFIKADGKGDSPIPLLLLHGWPGSVFEFLDLIPLLTDPKSAGLKNNPSFTVIAPSLPGFGMSFSDNQKRVGAVQMSDFFKHLMTDLLGYKKFATQGGDWGAFISTALAMNYPESVLGMHLNMLPTRPDPNVSEGASEAEINYAKEIDFWLREETAYTHIQGTKPQTLAYALTDSPAGLAAWIVEKFNTWTDNDGSIENVISRDRILANISLYWFTKSIGSSFWPYYDRHHTQWTLPDDEIINVPMGYAAFPKEIRRPPRSVAVRNFTNIRQWTEMPKGGHFAALEQPRLLAEDVGKFFDSILQF
jgi:microsomal epoxide hydrolase